MCGNIDTFKNKNIRNFDRRSENSNHISRGQQEAMMMRVRLKTVIIVQEKEDFESFLSRGVSPTT